LRTLPLCALAATLVACSHQPPLEPSCIDPNPLACMTVVRMPIEGETPKSNLSTTKRASTAALHKPTESPRRHALRLTRTKLKATNVTTRARSPQTNGRTAAGNAAASEPTQPNVIGPNLTIGVAKTRTIQDQVAAATAVAERISDPMALPDGLVAVLVTGPDINSVSDLAGKTIAIDERYSTSSRFVSIAVAAAGAHEVQLSEGRTTAMNKLINKEVSAAVVALVSKGAADSFPELAGFNMFRIPILPRSVNR
jgi:hypothetical protein